MKARKPIRELLGFAVTAEARAYDWSNGYIERWEYYECAVCDECGKVVGPFHGEDSHCDIDEESECEGHLYNEGPMMNYWWPLPDYRGDAREDAKKLADLPVCIVEDLSNNLEVSESYGLALTGGGMDLSWELAEAYMRLGYLPPLRLTDLPAYAGMKLDSRRRWIVAGCKETCRRIVRNATGQIRQLRDLRSRMNLNK